MRFTKRLLFFFCTLIIVFNSCDRSKPYKITHREPVILTDELLTAFPGSLLLCEDYFVWGDPFAEKYFANIIDRSTGKETGTFGNVGSGPQEFLQPTMVTCRDNILMVYDINSGLRSLLSIPKYLEGENYVSELNSDENSLLAMSTRLLPLTGDSYILLSPENKLIFKYMKNGNSMDFGPEFFNMNVKLDNSWDIFQGSMAYCPNRKLFVYAAKHFPYLAIYRHDDSGFHLVHENHERHKYKLSENNVILDKSKSGPMDMILTKDYIVTHRRDYDYDPVDENSVGHNLSKLPTTVFLYDYMGNLKEVVCLKKNVLRIAADINDNILYAIIVDEEFKIAKYNL